MKNKKVIIGIGIALVAIALVVLTFLKLGENEKTYTVKFDTDGGSEISEVKLKENTKLVLPSNPTKDGFTFTGWLLENTKFDSEMLINKDITLKASWLSNEVPKVTIKFNTNGGSNIDDMIIEKSTSTTLPNTSKKGYTFVEWKDENGNKVTNETVFENDITLTATWKENAKPTPSPKSTPEPTPSSTPKQTYTCPDGYELNETKCTKTYDAPHRCPDGYYEINGKCIEVVISKKVTDTLTCKNGEKIPGRNSCQGTRISSDSSSSCATAGGVWLADKGECRTKYEEKHTCPDGYEYLSNPSQYNSNIHGDAGCYPVGQMRYTCTNSKTDKLEGTKCITTIDATLK